jgi:hypothetical protein
MLSERSGPTTATLCNSPKDIRHCYRRENIPEDSVLRPDIADQFVSYSAGVLGCHT